MLDPDPDPDEMNADPQPWLKGFGSYMPLFLFVTYYRICYMKFFFIFLFYFCGSFCPSGSSRPKSMRNQIRYIDGYGTVHNILKKQTYS
jgi:hypothetical protein